MPTLIDYDDSIDFLKIYFLETSFGYLGLKVINMFRNFFFFFLATSCGLMCTPHVYSDESGMWLSRFNNFSLNVLDLLLLSSHQMSLFPSSF